MRNIYLFTQTAASTILLCSHTTNKHSMRQITHFHIQERLCFFFFWSGKNVYTSFKSKQFFLAVVLKQCGSFLTITLRLVK
jgi:hypothetical protein